MLKRIIRTCRTLVRGLFFTSIWRIGIIDKPIHEVRSNDYRNIEWLEPADELTSMADPFGFYADNSWHIICEQFSNIDKKGKLMSMEYHGNGVIDKQKEMLESTNHQSYPYTFIYDDKNYMMKEDSSNSNLELFQIKDGEVVYIKSIIKNFRAVDPTVIFYQGAWWLFCTNAESLECEYLYIFYSDRPDGEWKQHNGNPVKRDISSARPAGTPFIHEGILYRPGQDNSREYGKRIIINKVIEITQYSFHEEPVYVIEASKACRYSDGTHTISKFGNKTLVDAKINLLKSKL